MPGMSAEEHESSVSEAVSKGKRRRRGRRKAGTTISRAALWATVRILVFTLRELGAMGGFSAQEGLSYFFLRGEGG